jgi:hypothetical protein
MEFPEPTRKESLAIIVGIAGFWFFWAISASVLFIAEEPVGAVAFIATTAFGIWLFFGGILHVAARTCGVSVWRFYVKPPKEMRMRWMGLAMPSYLRRAVRVLGWNVPLVFSVLAVLLVVDLTVFITMMATDPSNTEL